MQRKAQRWNGRLLVLLFEEAKHDCSRRLELTYTQRIRRNAAPKTYSIPACLQAQQVPDLVQSSRSIRVSPIR